MIFMAKSKKTKKRIAHQQREMLLCPCCDTYRTLEEATGLTVTQDRYALNGGRRDLLAAARDRSRRWACDACLKSRRAIPGLPWLQAHCDWDPWAAFFDVQETCRECQAEFVFTKEEQQSWYEALRFWVQSYPVRCPQCRRNRRQRHVIEQTLSELHSRYNADDPAQSLEMADLYLKLGNLAKAKLYLSRARIRLLKLPESNRLSPFTAQIEELILKILG
jgi:hypothetical protein